MPHGTAASVGWPRRILALPVVLLLVLAAACNDSDSSDSSVDPSSSPSTSVPDIPGIDVSKVIDQIPLDGTEAVRLHWRLPGQSDHAEIQDATVTARRFAALDYYLASLGSADKHEKAAWFAAVADGKQLEQDFNDTLGAHVEPRRGPVWLWVDAPVRSGDTVRIRVCEDHGWHAPRSDQDSLPTERRSTMRTYRVEKTHPDAPDDEPAWRVTGVSGGTPQPDRSPFDRQCLNWANHTPPEAGT